MKIYRNVFNVFVCMALCGCVGAIPPLPLLQAPGFERWKEKYTLPSEPMPAERMDKDVVAATFAAASNKKQRGKLNVLKGRFISKNRAETEVLRAFVVEPELGSSSMFAHVAGLFARKNDELKAAGQGNPLSVSYYKACEKQGDGIRKKMMDACEAVRLKAHPDESLMDIEKRILAVAQPCYDSLRAKADKYLQMVVDSFPGGFKSVRLYREDNSGAFIFIAKFSDDCGVVVKIPNPYGEIPNHFSRRLRGRGGESQSLKRQVRRASAADLVTRECGAFGVRAPQKFLCLRPGAVKTGPINDRHCFVMSEFVVGESVGGPVALAMSDTQVDQLARVTQLIATNDFHDENVWFRRGGVAGEGQPDVMIMDTENTTAFVSPDTSAGYYWAAATGIAHPRILQYALSNIPDKDELTVFLAHRMRWLGLLVAEGEPAERLETLRSWIDEYLIFLRSREGITARQEEVLRIFWLSPESAALLNMCLAERDTLPLGRPLLSSGFWVKRAGDLFEIRGREWLKDYVPGFNPAGIRA